MLTITWVESFPVIFPFDHPNQLAQNDLPARTCIMSSWREAVLGSVGGNGSQAIHNVITHLLGNTDVPFLPPQEEDFLEYVLYQSFHKILDRGLFHWLESNRHKSLGFTAEPELQVDSRSKDGMGSRDRKNQKPVTASSTRARKEHLPIYRPESRTKEASIFTTEADTERWQAWTQPTERMIVCREGGVGQSVPGSTPDLSSKYPGDPWPLEAVLLFHLFPSPVTPTPCSHCSFKNSYSVISLLSIMLHFRMAFALT